MSGELKWQRLDQTTYNRPYYLNANDDCWYLMDYKARGGFSASPANQLISNFKKDPSEKGKPSWRYKQEAANTFAQHLVALLGTDKEFVISFIPGSKKKKELIRIKAKSKTGKTQWHPMMVKRMLGLKIEAL